MKSEKVIFISEELEESFNNLSEKDPTKKALIKAINERKYPFSGKRKGYNQVHISEIRTYNLRMKKEIVPLVIRDLGSFNLSSEKSLLDIIGCVDRDANISFFKQKLIHIISKIYIKSLGIMGLHPVTRAPGETNKFCEGWTQSYVWGMAKDTEGKMGEQL